MNLSSSHINIVIDYATKQMLTKVHQNHGVHVYNSTIILVTLHSFEHKSTHFSIVRPCNTGTVYGSSSV